jgi:formate C-acetyltransferase
MTDRVARLRNHSLEAMPSVSAERAVLMTEFYRENEGKYSVPVLRAMAYLHLCRHKTIYIGNGELIVGERGPAPKVTPTYPELTCHTLEDLDILNTREKTSYAVPLECRTAYEETVIPCWRGRSMRDRIFAAVSDEWKSAYEAGIFTEFMEQRAPGHTVADGKMYRKGLLDFKADIADAIARLDYLADPTAYHRREQLMAMDIAADATILFAKRHAELAASMAQDEPDAARKAELERIADVCRHVPAHAPRDFQEAIQMYWFCHLGVITELNGWDSFNPGHLDQHLWPFYERGLQDGTLNTDTARELLGCLWVKFNNHPAPPKVGVTAAESGTYTDFANINLGGLTRNGEDGSNNLSLLMLEVIDDLHILQPSNNVQISQRTPNEFLRAACRVIRRGYGFPSVFNADAVVDELLRQGKRLEDAREGGTSGCVEAGAFGKEAYILTGYFNLVKLLDLALHDGFDTRAGKQLGPRTGNAAEFTCVGDVLDAWERQVRHFVDVKVAGSQIIERMYASYAPAPFLSILIDDCISNGRDYNEGGARYNTSYIQGVGIGTLTDSLAAIDALVFQQKRLSLPEMVAALDSNFEGREPLRQTLLNRCPKYGNDLDAPDSLMREAFSRYYNAVEGRPNTRGGEYHIDMLPTTCHVYFGTVTGATPDGRIAWDPLSEGISPVQGADRCGPTAVLKSAAKMDHRLTGGTLLNQKFTPRLLEGEAGIDRMLQLIRTYFRMGGHHIQFNIVSGEALREAQQHPEEHRDLIVRVAGYSDYFCDLSRGLQDEIIQRTTHSAF